MKKIILFLVMSFIVFSCKNDKNKIETIAIGTFYNAIDYAPFYVAKELGKFQNSDILKKYKIEFKEFTDRSQFAQQIESERLHLIFAAEPPIIITKASGVNLKIAGISCTLKQEILIQKESSITQVSELGNSEIGVLQTTSSHYGLLKMISENKLDNVKVRLISPIEAKDLFETNKIDGWAVWPPFVEEQIIKGNGKVIEGGDAIIQSVMAIPDFVSSYNPKIASEFCKILEDSKKWIRENPEKAMNIVANSVQQDIDVVDLAWSKHNWSAKLDEPLIKDIQNKANFLAKRKETRNNVIVDVNNTLIFECQN